MKYQVLLTAAGAFAVSVAVFLYVSSQPKPLSSFDPQERPVLARMTLEEKIGQMTQPDQEFIKDLSDIEKYFFGSVLTSDTSDPKEGNRLEAWTNLYDRLRQHTKNTRLGIPLFYGIDAAGFRSPGSARWIRSRSTSAIRVKSAVPASIRAVFLRLVERNCAFSAARIGLTLDLLLRDGAKSGLLIPSVRLGEGVNHSCCQGNTRSS